MKNYKIGLIEKHRNKITIYALFVLYPIWSLYISLKHDFESVVFLPFRYEGLLFFKNAVLAKTKAFFFIRDWSTSPRIDEHPLLYFHNLDLIHLFAGFIQYNMQESRYLLFAISLAISLATLWFLISRINLIFEGYLPQIFLLLIVMPTKGFLYAPENLFVTTALAAIVSNFILLHIIWCKNEYSKSDYASFFFAFMIAGVVETNLYVFLYILVFYFVLYRLIKCKNRKMIIASGILMIISAIPLLIMRVFQFMSVIYFGYMDKFLKDINLSKSLKVHGDLSIPVAIRYFAKEGINYFGQSEPASIIKNAKTLSIIYFEQFGSIFIAFIIFLSVIIIYISNSKNPYCYIINKAKINKEKLGNLEFLSAYLLICILATFTILAITGNSIIKISMASHSFVDITLLFRAIIIIILPLIAYHAFYLPVRNYIKNACIVLLILVAIFLCRSSFSYSKNDDTKSYKKALSLIEPGSEVITNFEPSIVSIIARSRVSMSWFVKEDPNCDLMKSEWLIRMFNINKLSDVKNKYIFLVYYKPYSFDKKNTDDRHCIRDNSKLENIYSDNRCSLYLVKKD